MQVEFGNRTISFRSVPNRCIQYVRFRRIECLSGINTRALGLLLGRGSENVTFGARIRSKGIESMSSANVASPQGKALTFSLPPDLRKAVEDAQASWDR